MDLEKYIASGTLEFYVFDLLTAREEEEVEEKMVLYPKIKKELIEIENSLFALCTAYAKKAPPKVKNQIITEIDNLNK